MANRSDRRGVKPDHPLHLLTSTTPSAPK